MSLDALLVHDVDIVRPGATVDDWGNTLKDWSTATTTTVRGWISQQSTVEIVGDREAQLTTWRLFVRPDAAPAAADRVVWAGITFEVDGRPLPAHTPRGLHHVEVPLRVVEG